MSCYHHHFIDRPLSTTTHTQHTKEKLHTDHTLWMLSLLSSPFVKQIIIHWLLILTYIILASIYRIVSFTRSDSEMRATYYKAKVFDDPENHWDRRATTDELYVVLWHLYQVYDDSWKPREKDISKIPPKTVGVRFRFDVFSFRIDFFM